MGTTSREEGNAIGCDVNGCDGVSHLFRSHGVMYGPLRQLWGSLLAWAPEAPTVRAPTGTQGPVIKSEQGGAATPPLQNTRVGRATPSATPGERRSVPTEVRIDLDF
ncbi:hypothetical protein AAFF_G00093950 [Aldrovandia affinis]|uniref:Uncharacterized protein n=1 Tax=Aldrovandia affinis TaxID=143900 RepID=A0AAD7WZ04_9TELE|nr:hypothetical protein AAFF_G00093950 [Aldrovandia affinis]